MMCFADTNLNIRAVRMSITMSFISFARAAARRVPYRIALLLALVAITPGANVCRGERKEEYRRQLAAVTTLLRHGYNVRVGWPDFDLPEGAKRPPSHNVLEAAGRRFEPGDIVVEVSCFLGASGAVRDDDLTALLQLRTISSLDLRGGAADAPLGTIDPALRAITALPLTELRLSRSTVSDDGVRYLAQLSSLRSLDLGGTKISDAALQHVSKIQTLKYLDLRHTAVTDEGVSQLSSLVSLRWLNLVKTKVTGAKLDTLAPLRHLEDLILGGSPVNDEGVRRLAALTWLRELDLGYTKVTGAALPHLAGMQKLERLDLGADDIGAEGLRKLPALPKLVELELYKTGVRDDALEALERLDSLKQLSLNGCPISDAGLLWLRHLPSLKSVDLYDAKSVTAAGVARLKELRPDLEVDWASEEDLKHMQAQFEDIKKKQAEERKEETNRTGPGRSADE